MRCALTIQMFALSLIASCDPDGPRRSSYPAGPTVPSGGRFDAVRGVLGSMPRSLAVGRCDDDDALDVLSVGGDNSGLVITPMKGPRPSMFFGRGDGTFVEREVPALPSRTYGAAIFIDIDGDGRDDVVMAQDDVVMLRNAGGCRLEAPVTLAPSTGRHALSLLATDVDLDGVLDLVVALSGPTNQPYRVLLGQGDGRFLERPVSLAPLEAQEGGVSPFSAFFDDADGDGSRDLFALVDQAGGWFSWGSASSDGYGRDDAVSVRFSAADPMGIAPLDFDRDGEIDYFVAGVRGHSLLLQGGGRALPDRAFEAEVEGVNDTYAWGTWAFDADLDGSTDLLVLRIGEQASGGVAGPVELYLARGDATFSEVGARVVGQRLRAKAMACGDLSGRADRACLVMTDGGPLLLRDGLTPRGRWAGLRLQGTVSAVDATGARVSLLGAERPQVYYYGAQAPFGASHERSLVVGIGARDTADFEVRWPSGIRQRLSTVAAGRYTTVVEPAAVTLSRRVAPADGRSEVEVIVDAAAAGATTASLSARGPGSLSDEGADASGRHRWRLIAPTAAGEAVLTVSLDGTALRVRPRVRFTSPQGS